VTTQHFGSPGERRDRASERRSEFSKFTWRYLEDEELARLWDELTDWVWWLRDRYELEAELPSCWFRHGPVVEELTAAMSAWTAAYTDGGDGSTLSTWHSQTLWPLVDRLGHTRYFRGCSTDSCSHSSGLMHAPDGTEALMTVDPVPAEDSELAVVVRILGEAEMSDAEATGRAAPIGRGSSPQQRYRLHGHTWAWSRMLDAYVPIPEPALHALPRAPRVGSWGAGGRRSDSARSGRDRRIARGPYPSRRGCSGRSWAGTVRLGGQSPKRCCAQHDSDRGTVRVAQAPARGSACSAGSGMGT
jgi:hypothetical protein